MQDNFIESYNLFDKDYCNHVIECFEEANKHNLCRTRIENGINPTNVEDKAVHFPLYEYPMGHLTANVMEQLNEGLAKAHELYAEKYNHSLCLDNLDNFEAKIQKTKPGQGYHTWHCESTTRDYMKRVLVWTVYLNDDFDAGETEFIYQQHRQKPKTGDLLIFPAAFTHTHRGNPPIGGNKYIMTGWLEY